MFTINNSHNPYNIPTSSDEYPFQYKYVLYSTNTNSVVPYTVFYLYNENNILSFPELSDDIPCSTNPTDMLNHVWNIMKDYRTYISNITPTGIVTSPSVFYRGKTIVYMFYELQITNTESDRRHNADPIWPVVFWEIFHTGRVLNKTIDVEITVIFRSYLTIHPFPHPDGTDNNNSELLYPMVGYSAHPAHKLDFSAMFGASKKYNGPIGSYFYYYKDIESLLVNETDIPNISCVRYVIYAKKIVSALDHLTINENVIAHLNIYLVTNDIRCAYPISHHLL